MDIVALPSTGVKVCLEIKGSIEEIWEWKKYVVAFEEWVKDEQLGLF